VGLSAVLVTKSTAMPANNPISTNKYLCGLLATDSSIPRAN
jgi:hypothetical protein